jgi:hypothetical protein
MNRQLRRDPTKFLAEHPVLFWAALAATIATALHFARRARRAGGARRWVWVALTAQQGVQAAGMVRVLWRAKTTPA